MGIPHEIIQPARMGLMIMTPWTWSIAYRRFHQGMLIRFGHSKAVSTGTLIRLSADLIDSGDWLRDSYYSRDHRCNLCRRRWCDQ